MAGTFIDQIQMVFASPLKRLAHKTQIFARETVLSFNDLQRIIKRGEYTMEDNNAITQRREQFLSDNADTQVDQNVNRNTDTKRAMWLLCGVMLLGTIFSVKGLQFFFGEFYGSMNIWAAIVVSMLLAALLVIGSIIMNHFAEQQKGTNLFIFIHAKIAAYLIVLFLPVVNLIEGYDSNYSQTVMVLNIVIVLVDIVAHTALVSMHNTFITNENSKIAINKLRQIDKENREADLRLRSLNDEFMKSKNIFSQKATQFVHSYKQLETMDPTAATFEMFMLTNFLIWMINNKVMQHAILPYHANENGQPQLEETYFSPENDAIRKGWDQLSSVNGYTPPAQSPLPIANQPQVMIQNDNGQPNGQPTVNPQNLIPPPIDVNQPLPVDYNTILDDSNPNPNDKNL